MPAVEPEQPIEEVSMVSVTDVGQAAVPTTQPMRTDDAVAPEAVILRLRNVNAFYGSRRVVRDVSLDIARNAMTAIIGPSGSRQSTLLRSSTGCTKSYRSARAWD